MHVPQTFRSDSKFKFSGFWEGKSFNFENILTQLPVVSILLTPRCDQNIICSTRVSYQVNANDMLCLFLVNFELSSCNSLLFYCTFCIIQSYLKMFGANLLCKWASAVHADKLAIVNRLVIKKIASNNKICWV